MDFAARVIAKTIKTPERGRPQSQGEPHGSSTFLIGEWQCALEELCDGGFLTWLCFQANQQCDFDHEILSFVDRKCSLGHWLRADQWRKRRIWYCSRHACSRPDAAGYVRFGAVGLTRHARNRHRTGH